MAPSSVRIAVAVPKDMHGKVIGRGAATLKDIESDYGVDLTVPQRDDPSDEVIIEGPPEMCEAAKNRVLDICGMAPDISGGAREEARRLYDKASDLFSQGRHDEAHEIRRQAEQANDRAAQLIFKAKNKGYGNEQMDLHGLYVKEAMDFVRDRLVAVDSDLRSGALPSLTIITGFGHHSTNNEAKIKPQVEELLQERGYPFEADEAGGQFIVAFPDASGQPQSAPAPTHTTPNLPQPPTQEPQNQHQQQPSGTGSSQEKSAFDILIALGTCLFTMCKKKYDQYQADASANTNANSRSAENVTDPAAQTENNTATPAQQAMARV